MSDDYVTRFFEDIENIDADVVIKLKGLSFVARQNSPSMSFLKGSVPKFKAFPFDISLLVFGVGNKNSEIYALYFYTTEKSKELYNVMYAMDIYLSVKTIDKHFNKFRKWATLISPDGNEKCVVVEDNYIADNYCYLCKYNNRLCHNLQYDKCIVNRWFFTKYLFQIGFYCKRKLELRESFVRDNSIDKALYNINKESSLKGKYKSSDIEVVQKKYSYFKTHSNNIKNVSKKETEHEQRKSPAQHYRKGYVRRLANGKTVTVKATIVNKGKEKTIVNI